METVPVTTLRSDFVDYLDAHKIKAEGIHKAIEAFRKEHGLLDDHAWSDYINKRSAEATCSNS